MSNVLKLSESKHIGTASHLLWRRIHSRLRTGPLWRWRFVGPAPERLLFSPSCLRPSDPLVARDIYQGRFTFSGKTVLSGSSSIFLAEPPSPAWEDDLHSFKWLRHLQSADTDLASENGRVLIEDWLNVHGKKMSGNSWRPAICAARIIAWMQHANFILRNSEHGFYRRFLNALARQIRYLRAIAPGCSEDAELLKVRNALALASLTLPCSKGVQRRAAHNLEDQLKRQIYADGGHVSRNPDVLADILADLLPLRQMYVAASMPVPGEILRSIDRLFPMLRMLRHSDGNIAQFNGAGFGGSDLAASVLRHDNTSAGAPDIARQSGFQRLSAQTTTIIADVGSSEKTPFASSCHAGTLAFELSSGRSRIIVNAGVDRLKRNVYSAVGRATAAHSTLCIDNLSSSRFSTFKRTKTVYARLLQAPSVVETKPWKSETGNGFSARHNGYVDSLGLWHERSISLSHDGRHISGIDKMVPERAKKNQNHIGAVRFHLHPSITITSGGNENALQLTTDSGEIWRFISDQAKPAVEESIFLAGVTGPVHNQQIVLTLNYPQQDNVTWRLEKISQ